jgi:hypothetical protein
VAWATAIDDLTAPSIWFAQPTAPNPSTSEDHLPVIVRPTISCTTLRLRFSNSTGSFPDPLSGTQPVMFAAARIGLRAGARGARLVPGTNTRVTFHGKRQVTIAAGGTVLSDRVALPADRCQASRSA